MFAQTTETSHLVFNFGEQGTGPVKEVPGETHFVVVVFITPFAHCGVLPFLKPFILHHRQYCHAGFSCEHQTHLDEWCSSASLFLTAARGCLYQGVLFWPLGLWRTGLWWTSWEYYQVLPLCSMQRSRPSLKKEEEEEDKHEIRHRHPSARAVRAVLYQLHRKECMCVVFQFWSWNRTDPVCHLEDKKGNSSFFNKGKYSVNKYSAAVFLSLLKEIKTDSQQKWPFS